MSVFLSRVARYAARRIAFDPEARRTAAKTGRDVATEIKLMTQDEDRPRAAGRSIRRALNKLQSDRDGR